MWNKKWKEYPEAQIKFHSVVNNASLTIDARGFESAVTESKVYYVNGFKYNL